MRESRERKELNTAMANDDDDDDDDVESTIFSLSVSSAQVKGRVFKGRIRFLVSVAQ